MPELNERIRSKLKPTYTAPWAIKQYRAALIAALELHPPTNGLQGRLPGGGYGDVSPACGMCGSDAHAVPWPCPTVRAIAKELGIEVDDA